MKIRLSIAIITFTVLTFLSIAGFYLYKNFSSPTSPAEIPEISLDINNGGVEAEVEEESLKETRLLKDDFEITLPPGWQESTNLSEGILLMAIDHGENASGGLFEKLDFRTSLSVKSDDITRYADVDNFNDYVASVKISLVQTIPSISFVVEEQKIINGAQAILLECSSRQEDADFKTLLVFVNGNNNIVYAVSFNTFQDSWPAYKSIFYRTAESFKLKYKIEL